MSDLCEKHHPQRAPFVDEFCCAICELADAAKLSIRKGHHDTCSHALVSNCDCDCGHDALVEFVAKAQKP